MKETIHDLTSLLVNFLGKAICFAGWSGALALSLALANTFSQLAGLPHFDLSGYNVRPIFLAVMTAVSWAVVAGVVLLGLQIITAPRRASQ